MSIQDYKNIDKIKELGPGGIIKGETLSDVDSKLLRISDELAPIAFKLDTDILEMTIYSDIGGELYLVDYIPHVANFIKTANDERNLINEIDTFFSIDNLSHYIFFEKDKFFDIYYPYLTGNIKISFNFLRKKVSDDSFGDLLLSEISPSRTEGRIKYIQKGELDFNTSLEYLKDVDMSIGQNFFVNFGKDNLSSVLNLLIEEKDSIVVKFYDALSDGVQEKNACYLCEKIINSYVASIVIPLGEPDPSEYLSSLLPNFNIPIDNVEKLSSTYKSLDDLVSTSNKSTILPFLSSSSDELRIDYNDYDNFTFYSSAEKRLSNFKYKISRIEDYENDLYINSLLTQSLEVYSSSIKITSSVNNVKGSFTPYEKYLYYESSSYSTGSLGEFFERAWPKSNGTKSYSLYSVSSSKAISWYDKEIASASLYDNRNLNSLSKTIPLFIQDDDGSVDYLNFVDMIGEFFDEIFLYIKNLTNKNINKLSKDGGMSSGIANSLITQFGSDMFDEFGSSEISELFLNYNSDGHFVTSSLNPLSVKDQKNILYKKFISNLVYFLKTKGTLNNIHALANMFGISREYYDIIEYGGVDEVFKNFSTQSIQESSTEYLNLEYSLNFSGSQNVKLLWKDFSSKKPDSIIFKFKLNNTSSTPVTQSLFESPGNFALIAHKSGSLSKMGELKFLLSGSSGIKSSSLTELPIFDGAFWNVMVKRSNSTSANNVDQTYTLSANSIKFDKLMFYTSSVLSITGALTSSYNVSYNSSSDFYVGGTSPTSSFLSSAPFSGAVSDLKFYKVVLRDDIFKKHSLSQTLLISNGVSSSFDDLVTYLKFDDNKNLALTSSLFDSNVSIYGKNHATASNFSNNAYVSRFEKSIVKTKTLSLNNPISSKIRLDDNQISGSDGLIFLNNKHSIESISLSKYGLDSNRVDLIFSPSNIENKNISSLIDFDIHDFIGDPTLLFDDVEKYTQLETLYKEFRKIYPTDVNLQNYIDNIRKLTSRFFKNLNKFTSERLNLNSGILIAPNILERTNIVLNKSVAISNHAYSTILGATSPTSSAAYLLYTSSLQNLNFIPTGNYFLHTASLQNLNYTPTGAYFLHENNLSVYNTIVESGKSYYKGVGIIIDRDDKYFIQGPKRKILKNSYVSSSNGPVFSDILSSVFEPATSSVILPISEFKYALTYNTSSGFFVKQRNSSMEPMYDATYNTYYSPTHIRYYLYRSIGDKRAAYIGSTNTGPEHAIGATTIDGGKVIEITYSSPNKISVVSTDVDQPRLKVDGINIEI